jgi:hypothetical protein
MTEEDDLSEDDRRNMGRMKESMMRVIKFGCSESKRGVAQPLTLKSVTMLRFLLCV